jgi:hypothetical protein
MGPPPVVSTAVFHPGWVAERLNAPDLKSGGRGDPARGFESHPIRHTAKHRGVVRASRTGGGATDIAPPHRNAAYHPR